MSANTLDVLPCIHTLPLPDDESKVLFSRAVRLVRQRPGDFAAVGAWLDEHYSEAALRALCEQEYRQDFAYRLRLLRLDSHTYNRRLAIQRGCPLEKVKRERIREALMRGERLEGTQLVGKSHPVDTVVDESNVHLVFAWEDEQYRRRFRQIKAERRAAKLGEYDHPEAPGWRLGRAVGEIIEAGYPADTPTEHVAQSRKIVALASLLVWPEPLPMLGELGRWEWESKPDAAWEANPSNSMDGFWPKASQQPAQEGPHKTPLHHLHSRIEGREEVLFHRMPDEPRELQHRWGELSHFRALLRVAVDELEAVTPTTSQGTVMLEAEGLATHSAQSVPDLPHDAIQAEALRLRLMHWRIELTAGRTSEPADPSDPDPLANEWRRYRKAEADFWENHASKLPAASWHTVQTPVDLYWWLLERLRCLKLLHPELAEPPRPGAHYPVPPQWINEASDLADRYAIPRALTEPPGEVMPQQALSIFDSLLRATDKEIQRRNGGLPWRGQQALAATAQQFARLADAFDERSKRAEKAAHLQTDVNEFAMQAGQLLYRAIDAGAWEGPWPWARGRKPARDLFVYKDDFTLIPTDQAEDGEHNPERFRDGERFRLPRPELIPDGSIKPERMAAAFWIAALNVAGHYPNAFRINPLRLDMTDAEGDDADQLAFWRRRADAFADACRFISTLLRQQEPEPDAIVLPAGMMSAKAQSNPRPPSDVVADGPAAPNLLWYAGKSTTVEPIPWKLLDHAWRQRTLREADVIEAVWGHDSDVSAQSDGPLKSAIKKANRALDEVSCPLHVGRKNGFITLA
jgi:hypothetical protein